MLCLKCSTPNPDTSRFCATCGEILHADDDSATGSGVTKGFLPPTGIGVVAHALTPGTILNDRYRIIATIGSGGMGMVYKAVDLQLEVPVALKVIRPEYASDDKILERFKKEITIARKVTHKNVARIYDLGESSGLKYISMEFIEGQDLAHIIEHEAPLAIEKVVSILRQCCAALAEAHSMGVVHRDLKPHNVMIDAHGDVHLMDFGIALAQETRGLTRTGAIIGTPEYMSPEQAEGKKVDHRADIYSLGITIYEALTGVVPFSGTTQWEVIRKQIQDRPRPLKKLRAETPSWIETLVIKCMEKDPGLRYQSIEEVVRDLDRQKATRGVRAYAPKRRTVGLTVGAIVLVLAAAGVTLLLRPRGIVVGPGGRTSIAVLPFENQTGRADLDWLRTGIAENLSTDMAQSKYFRILTRERLGQILKDFGKEMTGPIDGETLARVADYGGVQAVVTGSFVRGGGDALRINLRVQDPKSGEGIGSSVVTGTEGEVLAMIDQLTLKTKELLNFSQEKIAADVDTTIASARTSSVEAASLYQQGVDLLDQGRNLEAIKPLEQATAKDADFALAYARLSQAYRALGYDDKAKTAGEAALSKVLKAIDRVTPADRAFIRAAHAAAAHNGQEAIEAYEEMAKADPFDATAAFSLGQAHEVIGTYDKAEVYYRKALEIDPKYTPALMAVGRIKIRSGHPDDSFPEFQKAIEVFRKVGSKEGEASGYQAVCEANLGLRRWEEALTYCNKSASIKEAIGDKRGLAASLGSTAYIYQVSGRLDEALKTQQKALAISREIGDAAGTVQFLTTLGSILEDGGNLPEALKAREEALGLSRQIGGQADEGEILQSLGSLRIHLGDLAQAEKDLDGAGAICRRLGIAEGTAQVVSDQGMLALARADISKAAELLDRAMSQWRSIESDEGVSETQYRLSLVAMRRGLYGTARKLATQALADYEKAGDRLNVARVQLAIGVIALRAGDAERAAVSLDAALASARTVGNPMLLADAESARAESARASGNPAAAEPLTQSVCARAEKGRLPRLAFACAMARGSSAIAAHDKALAASLSTEALQRAAETGRPIDTLDATLLRLRAQALTADPAAAAGIALLDRAAASGAGDAVLRGAPALGHILASGARLDLAPGVGATLAAALDSARKDLAPDQVPGFLRHGIDAEGCRQFAEQLRKQGRTADADRIEALLKP
ncbi:MAG TPA: protein kinase [Verrucomicrobiae bacterium]|nr:protein kinase [Verrucomicrobiae bacterium]